MVSLASPDEFRRPLEALIRRIERVLVKREMPPCALVSFALRFHLPGDHDELSSN
jgi:hypothetical protein